MNLRVSQYQDYRVFLKDWINTNRARKKGFSVRALSRLAGFKSTSHLSLVLGGKRNLSDSGAAQIAKAIKLSQNDEDLFCQLVRQNQAKNETAELEAVQKIATLRSKDFLEKIEEAKLKFFTHWYYIPVRELLGIPGASKDALSIANSLSPNVPSHDIKQAIRDLDELGLIHKEADGSYTKSQRFLTTGEQVPSAFIAHYHREMIRLASEAIERVQRNDRDISAVSLSLSPDGISRVQEAVKRFRTELAQIADQDSSADVDRVYQINIQVFPLTGKVYRKKAA